MPSNWYETFFHGVALELWSRVVPPEQTCAEAAFLEKALALQPGARVLDVPCGNGRLSLELAARGYTGLGIDIAEENIAAARQSGAASNWLCADMRQLPLEPQFDAAFCWGNSFGYLDHDGTRAYLAAVSAALKPGGRLAMESGAIAECLLPSFQPRAWYQVGDILMLADRRYIAVESRMDIDYTFIRDGQLDTRPASQCVYTAAEVQRMCAEGGLETEALYRSAAGEPFEYGARSMILVARKPYDGRLKRANELDGRHWTRFSISVWSDIRFTPEEQKLRHPAMFPSMLVERLIQCFTRTSDRYVLDPFMGSGSTLVAARNQKRVGVGFEVYPHFIELARRRLGRSGRIHRADAREIRAHVEPESVDFCVTSPPYWDILTQKRTADYKQIRHYGEDGNDLGRIADYEKFLSELTGVFVQVFEALRPGKYCVVNVMDLRKTNRFFPLHADLAARMQQIGFLFDDLIIWDRRQDYNNLRPLGYPHVFRVNKTHEFLLIFQKRVAATDC